MLRRQRKVARVLEINKAPKLVKQTHMAPRDIRRLSMNLFDGNDDDDDDKSADDENGPIPFWKIIRADILIMLCAALFGISFVGEKVVSEGGIEPFTVVAIFYIFTVIFFLMYYGIEYLVARIKEKYFPEESEEEKEKKAMPQKPSFNRGESKTVYGEVLNDNDNDDFVSTWKRRLSITKTTSTKSPPKKDDSSDDSSDDELTNTPRASKNNASMNKSQSVSENNKSGNASKMTAESGSSNDLEKAVTLSKATSASGTSGKGRQQIPSEKMDETMTFIEFVASQFAWNSELYWGILLGGMHFGAICFQQYGLSLTTAGKAGFISTFDLFMIPIFSYLLGVAEDKKTSLMTWFSMALCLVGIFLLGGAGGVSGFSLGDLLVLISTFFWGIHLVSTDIATEIEHINAHLTLVVFIEFAAVAFVAFIISVTLETSSWTLFFSNPGLFVPWFTFLAFTNLSFLFLAWGQEFSPPLHAGIILNMEGPFAALADFAYLGVLLAPLEAVGAVFIIISGLISELDLETCYMEIMNNAVAPVALFCCKMEIAKVEPKPVEPTTSQKHQSKKSDKALGESKPSFLGSFNIMSSSSKKPDPNDSDSSDDTL